VTLQSIALAAACVAVAAGCASLTVAQGSGMVVTGQVFDDRTQAGRVALEPEDVPPTQFGTPVPGCAVNIARRTAIPAGMTANADGDTSDTEGRFSVFGGRDPGPFEMTLSVDCPGYALVEHVFVHRGPRGYQAAVFVGRAP
jgi:hypothetical protein